MLVGDLAVATTAATATPTVGAAADNICSTSLACSSDKSDCCLEKNK